MEPFIVTANVTLVIGEQRLELVTGDEVYERDLPPGKWKSLVNTQTLVPKADYERMFAPAVRGVEPATVEDAASEDDADEGDEDDEEIPAWQLTTIDRLGLRAEAVIAYQGAGILTVRDALVYGAQHDGLATIRGIGKSTETATMAAIQQLMPKTEGEPTN